MEIFTEITELFCIDNPAGYSREDVDKAKEVVGGMPSLLELFFLTLGASKELQHLQDTLLLPGRYPALLNDDYVIFINENQGVCQAGIRKCDLAHPNPPVYVGSDHEEWRRSADTLEDFLAAMFGYQASICLGYSPEVFFWVTGEERAKIENLFPRRRQSLQSWLGFTIDLYGDNNKARIALMDTCKDFQMNYAANTETEFTRIKSLLKDIGEAM